MFNTNAPRSLVLCFPVRCSGWWSEKVQILDSTFSLPFWGKGKFIVVPHVASTVSTVSRLEGYPFSSPLSRVHCLILLLDPWVTKHICFDFVSFSNHRLTSNFFDRDWSKPSRLLTSFDAFFQNRLKSALMIIMIVVITLVSSSRPHSGLSCSVVPMLLPPLNKSL